MVVDNCWADLDLEFGSVPGHGRHHFICFSLPSTEYFTASLLSAATISLARSFPSLLCLSTLSSRSSCIAYSATMAQGGRPKPALDVLQSMINAVVSANPPNRGIHAAETILISSKLIETGKALRPSNKDGGRTLATVNTRLRTIIPSAAENFHMALDDLECDIVRMPSYIDGQLLMRE